MKQVHVFAIMNNRDNTEGRGPLYPDAYFDKKEDAEKICHSPGYYKKHGVMGTDSCEVSPVNMVIWESVEEYTENHEYQKKWQTAMDKLTEQEKRILGLVNERGEYVQAMDKLTEEDKKVLGLK
ncbi:MAG: hypothetical protein JRZ94_05475 [Nitrososphaerota archaeon]|nr:hypothetical protein [Nitrososphaerota archaeon]